MSSKQIITSSKVTPPKAPLSPAVKLGNLVFVSGQPAFYGDRQISDDFETQVHQVFANIRALLEEAGSSLDKIVKANVILSKAENFDHMNRIYRTYFKEGQFPARTTIACDMGNPAFLLEIECIAEA